ncbi:hypothetical protein JL720_11397 [Aureococcus anophagefferens]|nr:hypothetical protein JL720_11397 [Aureococcus anophagefferens]
MAAAAIEKHVRKAVRILQEGDDDAKIAAARNLANLADLGENDYYTTVNEVRTAKAGGIPPLVELLRDGSATAQACAAEALGNLAYSSFNFKVLIAEAGGIPPLVELLRHGRANRKEKSARALGTLAWANHDNAVLIAEAGAIPLLVELLRDGTASGKEVALCSLAGNNRANQVQIVAAGAIPPLVELLRDGSAEAIAGRDGAVLPRVQQRQQASRTTTTRAPSRSRRPSASTRSSSSRRGRVTVNNMTVVESAGIPAKRKAALVAGQLLETAAPRIRVTKYIKADIASYL